MTRATLPSLAMVTAALALGCGTAAAPGAGTAISPQAVGPAGSATVAPAAHGAPFAVWLHVTAPSPEGALELMSSDGRVLRTLPGGQFTADGGRLLAVAAEAAATRLRVLDARSGATIEDRAIPAGFHLPRLGPANRPAALAPGDRFAALEDRPPGEQAGSVKTSRVAVVDLAPAGATRVLTLAGDMTVDALSADGTQLYLIESLPPAAAGDVQYRVRRVDVGTGTLDPRVVVDKSDGGDAMAGLPLSRPPGGDPGWLLTLYGFGAHGPFVHGLGVDAGVAVCVDLPGDSRGANPEEQLLWSLVLVPGGGRALAVNGGTGQVVELTAAGPPSIGRTAELALPSSTPQGGLITPAAAKRAVSAGAVVSADGTTLYAVADLGIVAVDTATLRIVRTLATRIRISGLAIGPDGTRLLAVEEDGATVDLVDSRTGVATAIAHGGGSRFDAVVGPFTVG